MDKANLKVWHIILATGVILGQSSSQLPRATYVVYLATVLEDEFIISCGGSIIGSRTVLTSARCLVSQLEAYIVAGQQTIDMKELIEASSPSMGHIRKVAKRIVHEKFVTRSEWDFDAALALIEDEFAFSDPISDSVSSIQLSYYWAKLEDKVFMFGWESVYVNGENQKKKLTWAITKIACRSKGIKELATPGAWNNLEISTDGVLFVKDESSIKSFCHGYTGSPLVVEDSQIGIAIFGIDFGCQGLNAMSSIRRHLRWIERNKAFPESKNFPTGGQNLTTKRSHGKDNRESFSKIKTSLKKEMSPSLMESRMRDGVRIDSPEQFPFMVSIANYISDDPAYFEGSYCAGSILTQWIVLTAAHCIRTKIKMIVYAGIVDESKFHEGAAYQHIQVDSYQRHPEYSEKGTWYDIALLLLSSPLKFNVNVTSVCQMKKEIPTFGVSLSIAGWGILGDGSKPLYPSWINVTVSNVEPSGDGEFGLDTASKPTECPGDSGAAYFNNEHEVAGVHVRGRGRFGECATDGTVGMSTSWVFEWLEETIIKLEDLKE